MGRKDVDNYQKSVEFYCRYTPSFDRYILNLEESNWGDDAKIRCFALFKNEEVQMTNAGNALTVIRMNLKSKYRNDLQW